MACLNKNNPPLAQWHYLRCISITGFNNSCIYVTAYIAKIYKMLRNVNKSGSRIVVLEVFLFFFLYKMRSQSRSF